MKRHTSCNGGEKRKLSGMKMDTKEAVELAKEGKEEGFSFLYQETYQKSYYVALKYMKNEEEALDVLQDAYIKAFNHMHQLQEAEKFSQWFAKIVATTALNELKKKKVILFSQMNNGENSSNIEDTFEDDRIDTQPELSYDQKETERLIKEMLDTISDEQRICMLMYYTEQLSVKEIAETLNCSENTVKSRLNYGRKNIKEKVLELERKGTKLYTVSPIVFFMLLLSKDIQNVNFTVGSVAMLKGIEKEVKKAGSLIGRPSAKGLKKGIAATGKTITGFSVKNFMIAVCVVALVSGTTATVVVVRNNYEVKEAIAKQEALATAAEAEKVMKTEAKEKEAKEKEVKEKEVKEKEVKGKEVKETEVIELTSQSLVYDYINNLTVTLDTTGVEYSLAEQMTYDFIVLKADDSGALYDYVLGSFYFRDADYNDELARAKAKDGDSYEILEEGDGYFCVAHKKDDGLMSYIYTIDIGVENYCLCLYPQGDCTYDGLQDVFNRLTFTFNEE